MSTSKNLLPASGSRSSSACAVKMANSKLTARDCCPRSASSSTVCRTSPSCVTLSRSKPVNKSTPSPSTNRSTTCPTASTKRSRRWSSTPTPSRVPSECATTRTPRALRFWTRSRSSLI
uniref:(northern house mosquito) hypothetical protein n=1 Tax=Culex pipiens TaxID=7175 RepID=A0A8D8A5U8_CULPI